ncbi:MAG TPA: ornithine cyclodeaminase family protein, partial [Telluria sp.]|nr:ornithine cyclodeaminase family protein [Telluria sp.]
LRQVSYVTYDGGRDIGFESAFAGLCDMSHSTDRDHAVSISDIVITATPGGGALFNAAAVQPGTHINCVGADTKGKRELPDGLLDRVKLFVDDAVQARQIGETQWSAATPCTELGDLVTEKVRFQRAAQDITVFDMTGLALQDLTVARLLHQSALANGSGTRIPWSW